MAKRRLSHSQLESLRQQARESRQQYWDEHAEEVEQSALSLQAKPESSYTGAVTYTHSTLPNKKDEKEPK